MLYRFHSVISKRDEKWLNEFLADEVFPNIQKPLSQLNAKELIEGLIAFEKKVGDEPKERTFGGLKRDAEGKFNDAEMVKILKESIEDPAGEYPHRGIPLVRCASRVLSSIGLFGARMIPKALRVVEILGILQARKWYS